MGAGRGTFFFVAVACAAACASNDGATDAPAAAIATSAPDGGGSPPPFVADFGDAGRDAKASEPAGYAVGDAAFHARVKQQIRGLVRGEFAAHDWDTLLLTKVPFSGVMIWIPGTGEHLADDPTNGRAMAAVPAGLEADGSAKAFVGVGSIGFWLGIPCAQSVGGDRFTALGTLSALEVFDTAWPDAKAILAALGPLVKGAWLVGHSAGANPAMLAGVVGGAARVDVYGVPSAVGQLDGDDGLAHFHTHPLDPTATMGHLGADGSAELDLLGAFATTIKAGGTLAYHDYRTWPAPSP